MKLVMNYGDRPPSEVSDVHPNAQPGEHYGLSEAKGRDPVPVGPADNFEEIAAQLRALDDGGQLSMIRVVDEREYRFNKAFGKISDQVRDLPIEETELIFNRLLEWKRE